MKFSLATLLLTLLLSGCAAVPMDAAHPTATQHWQRTELYFGTGPADDAGVDESQWRAFLDAEVTPRFPDGLSVIDLYGQWRDPKASSPERLRSKLLILLHPASPQNDAAVDAIREAWKKRTGDSSVLRVTQPAEVSF